MSAQATFWAWEQDVAGVRKLVLLNLADTADHEGVSWPSQKRMAAQCGLSVATVKRSIDELEEAGLLEREERFRSDGGRTSSVYRLLLERATVGSEGTPRPALGEPPPSSEGATKNLLSEPTQNEPVPPPDKPAEVWAHYVETMQPRHRELDSGTRTVIRDALKVASAEECKLAVSGCRASDFHMGQNDRGKKYNAVSQILKGKRGGRTTREQIDFFIDIAEKAGSGTAVTSVDPVRLTQAKQDVLTAWEFPNSEQAKKAGDMSAAWLAQHGYRVEPDPETRRPRFFREGE